MSLSGKVPPFVDLPDPDDKSFYFRDLKYLLTEIGVLTSVDHRNIIRTFGIANIDFEYGLILEYLPNGSYLDFFSNFWDNECKTKGEDEVKQIEEKIAPLKIRIIGEVGCFRDGFEL